MSTFNYQRFLREKWGDPDRLTAFLHGYGFKSIQRATVDQWFRRGRIPSEWFAILLALLEIEHGETKVSDYLE